jgi:hypothetical protein
MRILFVTPFVPAADAPHGGGVYLAAVAEALAPHATLGLCALAAAGARSEPPSTTWAWSQVTELPRRQGGWRGLVGKLAMLWRWRRTPLVVAKAFHPEFAARVATAVAAFRPDVVCVEMGQMAQYLPALRGVPTVLTDHEAGCAANTRTGMGPWGDRRDRALWHRYARRTYGLATQVQAVTSEDAAALAALLGRPVAVRPRAFAIPARAADPGAAPPRAVFLGDYRHGPNPEAARRIASEVWPLVRERCPGAELWLAGPNEGAIADLGRLPGVRVLGFVPDLHALLDGVRLLLAPLYSGGGFRVKSLAALAHGVPVVTNELGGRGVAAPHPARTIAEDPVELAAAAARLLNDADAARRAGALARSWAVANLTGEAIAAQQLRMLGELADHARTSV